jgi:hypothetical protein
VDLASTIGEPPRKVDASLAGKLVDLQMVLDVYHVRGFLTLGFATGHARYRTTMPAGESIVAKDDNFNFRTGAGIGFAPLHVGRVRPAPYLMYVSNPLGSDNTVKHRYEHGLDIELEDRGDKDVAAQIILGAALVYETGLSYADFMTHDTYKSEYATKGVLLTLTFRLLVDGLEE